MNFLKVQGNDSLVRDTSSRAIINNNKSEYDNYVRQRSVVSAQKNEILRQADELKIIKDEFAEIKQLILSLINKQ
jgi:hypothetical protein